MKYLIDLEKIHQNRVTISINKRFLPKFIFRRSFMFKEKEKNLRKQFFLRISKQVVENLIMPNGLLL